MWKVRRKFSQTQTHLAFGTLASLHAIATLDHISLQAYRTRPSVQLEEQPAGVAEHGTGFIPAPQGSSGGAAILADGL